MDLPRPVIHDEHLRHLNFHIVCLKACCLEIVLSSDGYECDQQNFEEENGHLRDLLLNIETVIGDVEQDFSTLGVNITNITFEECYYCVTMDTDGVISSILERLELLNPYVRQFYDLISSKSSLSQETVKENIKLLVIHEFEEIAPLYEL